MSEKPSTAFEHQIERIHQLLEREPSRVTWNEKIPDPDNPVQLRQIDIRIERDGASIHVECRLHQSPQDVKWIEELIGRRASLGADAIIAVSSSGFTEGAIKKAARFNIHLRTLEALTDDEVRLWGNLARAAIIFYEFTECAVTFTIPSQPVPPIEVTTEDYKPPSWRELFDVVMKQCDDNQELDEAAAFFKVEVLAPFLMNGQKPSKIELSGSVRRIKQPVPLDTVLGYARPREDTLAQVQKHTGGLVEIIQSSNDAAFVSDSTNLVVPPNCFFRYVWMDFGRPVNMEWVKIISPQLAMQSNVKLSVAVTSPSGGEAE